MLLEVHVPVVFDLPIGATSDHVSDSGPLVLEPSVILNDEDQHALFDTPLSLIDQGMELI